MLVFEHLSAAIAGTVVLRDICTELRAGETVALVGRNGAGKTTLLRAVMGFVPPLSGAIRYEQTDLAGVPADARSRLGVGYAPEDRVIFPGLSVEDNLRFPCEVLRLGRAETSARLEQVLDIVPELRAMLRRSGAALSGGQGKMVALGRALMIGSKLVMLDEPFQGLAPVLALQYIESLHRLHQARPHLCILITESNRSLLRDVPDRTLVLERGSLTEAEPAMLAAD
jgi:ABC-type branched-subunit amino acid transport system ATPase component